MESPPDGCSILFGRNRRVRRERGIYVVRTNGGLIAKAILQKNAELGDRHKRGQLSMRLPIDVGSRISDMGRSRSGRGSSGSAQAQERKL